MSKRRVVILLASVFFQTALCLLLWVGIVQAHGIIDPRTFLMMHFSVTPAGQWQPPRPTQLLFAPVNMGGITPTAIPVTSPTSVASSGSDASGWTSPTIVVIIIAAVIAVLGTWFSKPIELLFTGRADRKKEAREEQARKDKEVQEARDAQKRQKDEENERVAAEMERKKTLEGYVTQYRERLRQDDTVTSIKILDMSRPVEVVSVYVQLKLRQDVRASATGTLDTIQKELDPNIILQVVRKRMEENYARQAIDPVQALRDNRQCILLGDPGAGKTTLLKYLTVQILEKSAQVSGLPDLPVFVELSKFAETKGENLEEFIARRWDNRYGFPLEKARAYIEQQLDMGNVVLLLDGLDEAVSGKNKEEQDESYRRTFEAITQTVTRYPQVYIIVTARIAGYRQRMPLAAFTELEVLDFRKEDIQQFVNKWFAGTDAAKVQKGKDLNTQLERNIRIQTLAANPLLLSLIVILYERRGSLPERRVDLYRQCVDMLLDEWDRRQKNLQRNVVMSVDKKRDLLKLVAWYFHNRQERYFPEDRLLREIGRVLPNVGLQAEQRELVLEEISAETGLLKEQAEGWYGFLHLTFQEYFVALYIVANGLLDELLTHRGQPWWEEVILLYAGSTDEIRPLIENLLALNDDIFATNVMLAGKCFAAVSGVDRECEKLQQQVITRLFEILHDTPYELNRTNAADTLAELGRVDETINTRFLGILADDNAASNVVQAIAHALSTYGKRSLVDKLLELLFDPNIQHEYVDPTSSILRSLASSDIIPILVRKLLDRTTDIPTRRNIVTILGEIGDHTLSAILLPLLLDPQEDYGLHLDIAFAWEKLGDTADTMKLLVQVADPKTDVDTLTAPIIALSFFDNPMITPVFLQLLQSQSKHSQISPVLIALLREANNKTIMDGLIGIIENHQIDLTYRLNLVEELRSMDGERKTLSMMQSLYVNQTLEPDLKREIALSLYVLGDNSISIDTQKILRETHSYSDVERAIIEHTSVSTQLKMLTDPDIALPVRANIAQLLANMNDTSIVPQLCLLAANRKLHLDVRKGIIGTLQTIANDEATVETLIGLINSDQQVRNEAEHALWYVSRRVGVRVVEDEMTRRVKIG